MKSDKANCGEWNLRAFHEQAASAVDPDHLLQMAEDAAAKNDAGMLLCWLDNTRELAFLLDNLQRLKALGEYEKSLLDAYTGTRLNHANMPLSVVQFMFCVADRSALLAAGDPLPGPGPFTVFRGVAGRGPQRRLRGLSWTADQDKAAWFASRFAGLGLANPAVLRTEIEAGRVYAYCNGRSEQEFICDVDGCTLARV